jgi:tetratricopeptide (TPR) repeat protein
MAAAHLWYGEALVGGRDLAAAELHLTQAAQLAEGWGANTSERAWVELVRTHSQRLLGYIEHLRGNYLPAIARYRRCRQAYHDMRNPRYESHTLLLSAETQRCLGDYASAKADYERALDLIRGTGNLDMEQVLLNNLGDVLTHLGCYNQAEGCLGAALALTKRTCNRSAEACVLEGLSRVTRHRGEPYLAETYARQALSQPNTSDCGWCLTALANALEAQGRLSEAAEIFTESVRWWGVQAETAPSIEALAGLSRVALARGALPDAVAHADVIYHHLGSALRVMEPLRVYMACWQAFQATDDPRAAEVLERATGLLAELGRRIHDPWLRRSFLEQVAAHREIVTAEGLTDRGFPALKLHNHLEQPPPVGRAGHLFPQAR